MPVAMPGAAGNTVNATSAASVPSVLDESGLETVAPKGIEFLQPNIKMAARRFSDFLEERAISFVGRGGWRRMVAGLGCPRGPILNRTSTLCFEGEREFSNPNSSNCRLGDRMRSGRLKRRSRVEARLRR